MQKRIVQLIFARFHKEETVISFAALYGQSECFNLLLTCGAAEITWRSSEGQSLHELTQVGIKGKASSNGPLLMALELSIHEKDEMERRTENAPSKKSSIRM